MNEVSLKPVIEELENLFSKFNARFFADKLEKPVITVSPDHTRGAYGWCTGWKAWKAGEDEGHYQWLCLLGIPALIAGVFKYLHTLIKRNADDNKALKLGVQALLRSQMISDFNKYSEKGYAPIYARESFENCWKQYHSLGVNGVMDDLHKKFLELPTEAPDE